MLKEVGHTVTHPGKGANDPPIIIDVPKDLVTEPGVPTRDEDVSFYSRDYPLEMLTLTESASFDWLREQRKNNPPEVIKHYEDHRAAMVPIAEYVQSTKNLEPTGEATGEDVTELLRAKAKELGYGEVGFTRFDHRYLYVSQKRNLRYDLPHVICLAYEQDYAKSQTTPSLQSEETHEGVYEIMGDLTVQLVDYIRSLGYRAQVNGPTVSLAPVIPFFVAAGLGQLGANGQLLSPHFGSWARLQLIHTNANVTYDQPKDFGIHAFCQICLVCVNRCPGRALQREKIWYRGIEKNKVTFKRCQPIVAKYLACGVCMKVCPIGAYGVKAVMDHYLQTGEVLGKGTHNLEGYSLPGMDYYGPDEMPRFTSDDFKMPQGRSEDWMLVEFRDRYMEVKDDPTVDKNDLWKEFRDRVEDSVYRSFATAMATDDGERIVPSS